jgi:hypothetical protein
VQDPVSESRLARFVRSARVLQCGYPYAAPKAAEARRISEAEQERLYKLVMADQPAKLGPKAYTGKRIG